MNIIVAQDRERNDLTDDQIRHDMPKLLEAHRKAIKENPTWEFFGGTLVVNDHEYQVR